MAKEKQAIVMTQRFYSHVKAKGQIKDEANPVFFNLPLYIVPSIHMPSPASMKRVSLSEALELKERGGSDD